METLPAMLNKLFGTKMKVISGYKGGNDIYLAIWSVAKSKAVVGGCCRR